MTADEEADYTRSPARRAILYIGSATYDVEVIRERRGRMQIRGVDGAELKLPKSRGIYVRSGTTSVPRDMIELR